jgi:hypothetical protein
VKKDVHFQFLRKQCLSRQFLNCGNPSYAYTSSRGLRKRKLNRIYWHLRSDVRRPGFARAFVLAMGHSKPIDKLNNFEEGWDMLRFLQLLEKLPNDDPFPHRKDVVDILKKGRKIRHDDAHSDGSRNQEGFDDDDLYSTFICGTKKYLPLVNGMNDATETKFKRLKQLIDCIPNLWAIQAGHGEVIPSKCQCNNRPMMKRKRDRNCSID